MEDSSTPVHLARFLAKEQESPIWVMDRTRRYAEDPIEYLNNTLGHEAFQQRKPRLCIPDKIDRDTYGTGSHQQHFEQHVAKLLGKQHGLFFITGVQAQLAAVKTYCDVSGNNRVAWHVSSHLESAEEQAWKHLYGLDRILLGQDAGANPTVAEIIKALHRPVAERPAVVLLEIPNRSVGCNTYSFEELETIALQCRKANVKLHCDGARLWEIEPYYVATAGKSFAEIGALFDSVYVSFYKGLGGVAGAVLATDDGAVVSQAKQWRRRTGGNIYTQFFQVIDDERGFNENIGTFPRKWEKMREIVDGILKATSSFQTEDEHPYISFKPERPLCCQIHTIFQGFSDDQLLAARDAVEKKEGVRVFEKLRPKQTLDKTHEAERESEQPTTAPLESAPESNHIHALDKTHSMEWMITGENEKLDVKVFVRAYVSLCEELATI